MELCDSCKGIIVELLEKRIRKVLAVYREEGSGGDSHAEVICFHLMELQRTLQGQSTCSVYDDKG